MNKYTVLIVGLGLSVAGCTDKEQVVAESAAGATMVAPEVVAPELATKMMRDESFVSHMHVHAEKLDEINFALADDNLQAARSPAGWLASHDTDDGIQTDWLPFLYAMRTEAKAVEQAPDIATARSASERITAHCQGCHTAVGINSP